MLAAPPASWPIAAVLALIVATAAIALAVGERSRTESVPGRLVPTHGLIRLHASEPGRVSAVHVAEGDAVEAGDALLTVTHDPDLVGGKGLATLTLAHLEDERNALGSRLGLVVAQHDAERDDLLGRKANLSRELASVEHQIATHGERVRLAAQLLERLEELQRRGFVAELDRLTRQDAVIALRADRERLVQNALRLNAEIDAVGGRLSALGLERDERLAELRTLLAGNGLRRSEADRHGHTVVLAPIAGRVAALPVHVGQTLAPHSFELALLPNDATLQAEIFVPTRAAGFIVPDQAVRLLYDAFPYQKFGSGMGTVERVARTALSPRDLAIELPSVEPVYRATVALDRQTLETESGPLKLHAGMTLRADVVLERRKLWEWLFEPLLALFERQ